MRLEFIEPEGSWRKLLPLTYTRPVADLRIGILKICEKWCKRLSASDWGFRSEAYLNPLFTPIQVDCQINSTVLPTDELIESFTNAAPESGLYKDGLFLIGNEKGLQVDFEGEVSMVQYPWDIFRLTRQEIEVDFDLITKGRTSAPIDDTHTATYGEKIFLEERAEVRSAVLNAENGPIYLGKNSKVNEGALIRGAFALGENSQVSMGAKLRGDTSVGPGCKIGGEVSNSSIQGYSNKSHDGFLGNSVIGEWCNLGADTNNSNLKNNYTNVKMWDFESERFKDTGLQFCGLIMGDHSKCGINTMFNTGTTVGVSANIFGSGFPRTIVPSFAWGGASGFSTYTIRKAIKTAELVVERRGLAFGDEDRALLAHVFALTTNQRIWEK